MNQRFTADVNVSPLHVPVNGGVFLYNPLGIVWPTNSWQANYWVDVLTQVTITGTGFQAGATVSLGGTAATGVAVSSTSITTTAGHAAGAVNVVVTNTDGQSGTLSNGYTWTYTLVVGPTKATGLTSAIYYARNIEVWPDGQQSQCERSGL